MITQADLKQYRHIQASIDGLNAEIKAIYESSGSKDGVMGGRVSSHTISDPTRQKAMLILAKREDLEEKIAELEELMHRIADWMKEGDPHIVQICRMHYIEGMSWSEVCEVMYGYPDKHYCRKLVSRYFQKMDTLSTQDDDIL